MDADKLATWWKEAQEAARPQRAARALVDYLREEGEADLEEARHLLTEAGIEAAEQLPLLASMVSAGTLREIDDADGLRYDLQPAEREEPTGKPSDPYDWTARLRAKPEGDVT